MSPIVNHVVMALMLYGAVCIYLLEASIQLTHHFCLFDSYTQNAQTATEDHLIRYHTVQIGKLF